MMNLELLCWVSENGGEARFREIAVSHSNTTLINHFRPDNSSWHVVDYDHSPYNAGRPIPNRPAAGLIGRIGSDVFFIGNDTGPMRMRSSGRLSLGVNDDYLQDNRGAFRVTVYY